MREDAASKVERYRRAANKYGEMAKLAEPDYLAAVFRKVAVRYVFMADEALREAEHRRGARLDRAGYTCVLPPPTVTSIAPTSGTTLGGTAVTITGTAPHQRGAFNSARTSHQYLSRDSRFGVIREAKDVVW
jgi:hypothetical protein